MQSNAKAIWTIAHRSARLPTSKESIEYILANLTGDDERKRAIRMMSQAALLRILAGQNKLD